MLIDYATLRFIWWVLLGVLMIGFAVLDGFDLGVAILHPFVARNDAQRRVLLTAIGPVWEGNQIWFVLAGGAAFAAWPPLYAASFSGFYLAMMLVLLGLILRPVALTFRSKLESAAWRRNWDYIFFLSGLVPSLVFGVAFGNLLLGTPFHIDRALQAQYEGNLLGLLNPFALLCGLVSVAMLALQGASYLASKTEGAVARRAAHAGLLAALALVVLFSAAGAWVAFGVDGYAVQGVIDHAGPSNPLWKTVLREKGAWLNVYRNMPAAMAAPALAYAGALVALVASLLRWGKIALVFSSAAIAGVILTAGFSMFPFLFPSSSRPSDSLTVWDASSSQLTLELMLLAVVVLLPIVLAYTAWVYRVMRGPISEAAILRGDDFSY